MSCDDLHPRPDARSGGSALRRSLPVAVTAMAEAPAKPLRKDSTRILSMAAFLFSVITGVFAMYIAYETQLDKNINSVGKLIDQYFKIHEKLDANSYSYNLMRTQLRSIASRAFNKALSVQDYMDDGIWMSIGQINEDEMLYTNAEDAWLQALKTTPDLHTYLFILRSLAENENKLHKINSSTRRLEDALTAASGAGTEGRKINNDLSPTLKAAEIANIHLAWVLLSPNDCKILTSHYDAAADAIAEAEKAGEDPTAAATVEGDKAEIERYREARSKCN